MRNTNKNLIIVLSLLSSFATGTTNFTATRIDLPPVIDGRLDDTIWQSVQVYSHFATYNPDYGLAPSQETLFRIAYDAENIYVAIEANDTQPAQLKSSISNWDELFSDDWVGIIIDGLNDRQTAAGFMVNGAGSQGDVSMAPDGVFDQSIDYIWDAAGGISSRGFSAEMAIPLKSLRYKAGTSVAMGVSIIRNLSRDSQMAIFPPIAADKGSFLTQIGTVIFEGLNYERTIEILPAFTQTATYQNQDGSLVENTDGVGPSVGLTAKIGLTATTTLDLTVNPDFSQVEADASQVGVNLAFPNFFSEKRPFFLEGLNDFNIAGLGFTRLLHTRTIAAPKLGAKVTGKFGESNAISALVATDESDLYLDHDGTAANIAHFRYKRFLGDDSYIGAVSLNRDHALGVNRINGIDGVWRINGTTAIQSNILYATLDNQQPGTVMNGTNFDLAGSYTSRSLGLRLRISDMTEGFGGLISTGAVQKNDMREVRYQPVWNLFPKHESLQRLRFGLDGRNRLIKSPVKDVTEWRYLWWSDLVLPRSTTLIVHYHYETEVFAAQRFRRNGPMAFLTSQVTPYLYASLSYIAGGVPIRSATPEQGDLDFKAFTVIFTPSDRFTSRFSKSSTAIDHRSDAVNQFDISLLRSQSTFQLNKYLRFRAIFDFNQTTVRAESGPMKLDDKLTADFLASFTYIPGTVLHLGYGSSLVDTDAYPDLPRYGDDFYEMNRGIFFKASYNWRL